MAANNNDRAEWARVAVEAFRDVCHGSKKEDGSPLIEEAVGDLIADMLHLCDQEGVDPLQCVRNGVSNYVAETFDNDGMSHEVETSIQANFRPYGSGKPWAPFVPTERRP
jgi:hypothetical protein